MAEHNTNVSWRLSSESLQPNSGAFRLQTNVSRRHSMLKVSRLWLEPLQPRTPSPLSFHVPGLWMLLQTRLYLLFAYLTLTCPFSVLFDECRARYCLGPALLRSLISGSTSGSRWLASIHGINTTPTRPRCCWQHWKRHHPRRDEDLAERGLLARLVPSVPRASYPKKQCHKS